MFNVHPLQSDGDSFSHGRLCLDWDGGGGVFAAEQVIEYSYFLLSMKCTVGDWREHVGAACPATARCQGLIGLALPPAARPALPLLPGQHCW